MTDTGNASERGLEIRRAVLGAEYVDAAIKNADEFTEDLQDLVTRYCWGEIWAREGLTRRERSLINLAMIAALNRPNELRLHVRGALRNGLTRDEIKEVLLHMMIYCGVPAGVDSFKIAREAFQQVEKEASA